MAQGMVGKLATKLLTKAGKGLHRLVSRFVDQPTQDRVVAMAERAIESPFMQKLMTQRAGLSAVAGLCTTLALFYLMQALISGADNAFTEDKIGNLVEIVRVKEDLDNLGRRLPKPDDVEVPPEQEPPEDFPKVVTQEKITTDEVKVSFGDGTFSMDGDYLPIVKVEPQYPRRALTRGIAGWVILEFTVTAQGTVENPIVVENCGWVQNSSNREEECYDSPNSIFDAAAKRAALKFKYQAKVRDGKPVATPKVQNLITFKLEDEDR